MTTEVLTQPLIRILAVTSRTEHASFRQRLLAISEELAPRGIELTIRKLPKGLAIARVAFEARSFDALWIHRRLLPWAGTRLLSALGVPWIYDIDDALMRVDETAAAKRRTSRAPRFQRMVAGAVLVLVGNRWLEDQVLPHNQSVLHAPTGLRPELYPLARNGEPAERLRLVWIGGSGNAAFLLPLRPVLEELAADGHRISLRLVTGPDVRLDMGSVPIERCVWSPETEAVHLSESHIGIAPSPRGGVIDGKCGYKVIQYMAAGLPVVAERLACHEDIVDEGISGRLAEGPFEWKRCLEELILDAPLRQQRGLAARAIVERDYSIAGLAASIAKELHQRFEPAPVR